MNSDQVHGYNNNKDHLIHFSAEQVQCTVKKKYNTKKRKRKIMMRLTCGIKEQWRARADYSASSCYYIS